MKRIYMIPDMKVLACTTGPVLYDASVPYGGENDDQGDEANGGFFDDMDKDAKSSRDLWAD